MGGKPTSGLFPLDIVEYVLVQLAANPRFSIFLLLLLRQELSVLLCFWVLTHKDIHIDVYRLCCSHPPVWVLPIKQRANNRQVFKSLKDADLEFRRLNTLAYVLFLVLRLPHEVGR